jgi:hypothetical protein
VISRDLGLTPVDRTIRRDYFDSAANISILMLTMFLNVDIWELVLAVEYSGSEILCLMTVCKDWRVRGVFSEVGKHI